MVHPTDRQKLNELRKNGYVRGESFGATCTDCEKPCGRGWWQKVSYEYDEWECWCRECAYKRLHQYDDLDPDELMKSFSKGGTE